MLSDFSETSIIKHHYLDLDCLSFVLNLSDPFGQSPGSQVLLNHKGIVSANCWRKSYDFPEKLHVKFLIAF